MEYLGIALADEPRRPITDPTLGVDVPLPPPSARYAHRMVTLGDSLTHGFHHLAVHDTELSWPSLVARQLGIPFSVPAYASAGGYPLNLEYLLRAITRRFPEAIGEALAFLGSVKAAYGGAVTHAPHGARFENLAVFGWDLRDLLLRTADTEAALIRPPGFGIHPMVNEAQARAGLSVLDSARHPSGRAMTAIDAARAFGDEDGGIETLCVWIGANNALQSVGRLSLVLSGPDYQDLEKKSAYTVWRPEHFAEELHLVTDEVRQVDARHVLWGTVPHVTIPPIAKGLGGPLEANGRYFAYYGRPWETEDSFDPIVDPKLTGMEAWTIDSIIDTYNSALEQEVADARRSGLDWRIVDLCGLLDRLAVRRNDELGTRPPYLPKYQMPTAYQNPDLTTAFPEFADDGSVVRGGIIGLDGTHPTTAGYGLVAQEFITAMAAAGVDFEVDGGLGGRLDYDWIRSQDSLLADPPANLTLVLDLVRHLDNEYELLKYKARHA